MSNWAHEILVENEVDQKRTKPRQFLIHAIPMLNPRDKSITLWRHKQFCGLRHLYIYSKIQSDGVTGSFILSYDFGFNFKLFKDYPTV